MLVRCKTKEEENDPDKIMKTGWSIPLMLGEHSLGV
jgi:hypothetical protein